MRRHISACVGVLAISALGVSSAVSQDSMIPHKFTSGTPAKAEEVNSNFERIEDAVSLNRTTIDSNAESITRLERDVDNLAQQARKTVVLYDSSRPVKRIGEAFNFDGSRGQVFAEFPDESGAAVPVVLVVGRNFIGGVGGFELMSESDDCSGPLYMDNTAFPSISVPATVIGYRPESPLFGTEAHLYVADTSFERSITVRSQLWRLGDGEFDCYALDGGSLERDRVVTARFVMDLYDEYTPPFDAKME